MSLLDTSQEGNNQSIAIGLISEIYKRADKQAREVWEDHMGSSFNFFDDNISYQILVDNNTKLTSKLDELGHRNTLMQVELVAMKKLKEAQDQIIASFYQLKWKD